jgi:hypothetical protein
MQFKVFQEICLVSKLWLARVNATIRLIPDLSLGYCYKQGPVSWILMTIIAGAIEVSKSHEQSCFPD